MKETQNPASTRVTSASDAPCVILVEDHRWYRNDIASMLAMQCGIESLGTDNALQALTLLEQRAHSIAAVVSDERLPRGMQGTDLLEHIGKRWPHIPRMLLSAWTTGAMVAAAPYPVIDKIHDTRTVCAHICALVKP